MEKYGWMDGSRMDGLTMLTMYRMKDGWVDCEWIDGWMEGWSMAVWVDAYENVGCTVGRAFYPVPLL